MAWPVGAQSSSDTEVVLIYQSTGEKTDKAFIDMARAGAEQAKSELSVPFIEHALQEGETRERVFERYARQGKSLIIGVGFQNVKPVTRIAEKYPDTLFVVVDGKVPPVFNNVKSVIFRDNEGGFLAGMIAALRSKTGTIGFIGGMDVPVIRDFAYGYQQGAHYAVKDIRVKRNMIGKTPEAFSDPVRAAKLAREQIADGADILFAAAGGSSIGVLEAAASYDHVYAIGIDTNQNGLFPNTILSSIVKRVDKAVYEAIKETVFGDWKSGVHYFGIQQGALDYAVDVHNRKLLSPETVDKVEQAKDYIYKGFVKVDSYRTSSTTME